MKHEAIVKKIFAEVFHEDWMDDEDREEFDTIILAQFGERLDRDIDEGIANGYSPDQQADICIKALKQLRERGRWPVDCC